MAKPKVTLNCVANTYTGPDERIIEYSGGSPDPSTGVRPGGLIRFRAMPDGRLIVDIYRHDPTVEVRVGQANG